MPDTDPLHIFARYDVLPWSTKMQDTGQGQWSDHWFLDGELATVETGPQGMDFCAGPEAEGDASHAVLWTHDSFTGPIRVDLEMTRLDEADRFVNILYLLATGVGHDGFDEDITAWSDRRAVPAMKTYFNHMKLLHISYAAFPNQGGEKDYIRARRYPVDAKHTFAQTALDPSYNDTGLFDTGKTQLMTAIAHGSDLCLRVIDGDEAHYYAWDTSAFEPITHGRVGIRHMLSRCSRYKNIRIACLP